MYIDLHLHSKHSDGNWTVGQIVSHAAQIGLSAIAITDHDSVSGLPEAIELCATAYDVELVAGVEINTVWSNRDVHVLGYFIDNKSDALSDLFARQVGARHAQAAQILHRLKVQGYSIPDHLADLSLLSYPAAPGKVHMANAISAITGLDVMQAYHLYLKRSGSQYVERASVSPLEAVQAIRMAGGIASIAHSGPLLQESPADFDELLQATIKAGLRAIEVFHPQHDEALRRSLRDAARQYGLLETGGSDCHGPYEDHPSMMGTQSVPRDLLEKLASAI